MFSIFQIENIQIEFFLKQSLYRKILVKEKYFEKYKKKKILVQIIEKFL